MDAALRALNRFGLGARVGERRRLSDPRGWLRDQLNGDPPALAAPDIASPDAIGDALRSLRPPSPDARRHLVEIAAVESRAAIAARVTSDRPFIERLVAFWSNHLCVSAAAKILVAPLAGSYERGVIRRHVLGRFEDMVLASAKHPAMLVYLDNFQSIGPASNGGRRRARGGARRGLNENYARELLELHTLGVNGGYTQQDVQELAKILTGWTVSGLARGAVRMRAGPITFAFAQALHEPGDKTVLNARYGAGLKEGERAIRTLCRHPATATFVATKLVAHFVSDEPPAGAVERTARVFRDSDGDLRKVSESIVDLPDAWTDSSRKFRAPQDWLVAALRATVSIESSMPIVARTVQLLRQLRHPLWSPQAPKGFGDTTQEWADPDSLLNRAELARTLARRLAREIEPIDLADVVDTGSGGALQRLLSDRSIRADERIALALAGPAFQWR